MYCVKFRKGNFWFGRDEFKVLFYFFNLDVYFVFDIIWKFIIVFWIVFIMIWGGICICVFFVSFKIILYCVIFIVFFFKISLILSEWNGWNEILRFLLKLEDIKYGYLGCIIFMY